MQEQQQAIPQLLVGFRLGAAAISCSEWSLRQWARAGLIATVKIGSRRLIPRAELERIAREGLVR